MNLFVGVGLYIGLIVPVFCKKVMAGNSFVGMMAKLSAQYLSDIKTVPNFLIALLLFMYFKNRKVIHSKPINTVASLAFPIYIFHQVPAFYPILWNMMLQHHARISPLYVMVVFLTIMLTVAAIECFRRRYIEPLWLDSRMVTKVEEVLDTIYSPECADTTPSNK